MCACSLPRKEHMNELRFFTFTRNGSRPVYARDNGHRKSGRTMPFQGRVCAIALRAVTNHLAYQELQPAYFTKIVARSRKLSAGGGLTK